MKKYCLYLSLILITSTTLASAPFSLVGTWLGTQNTMVTTESLQQSNENLNAAVARNTTAYTTVINQQNGNYFIGYNQLVNHSKKLKMIDYDGHRHYNSDTLKLMGMIDPIHKNIIYIVPQSRYPASFARCTLVSTRPPAKMICVNLASTLTHSFVGTTTFVRQPKTYGVKS